MKTASLLLYPLANCAPTPMKELLIARVKTLLPVMYDE